MAGYRNTAAGTGDSAPSEAWLFAQALLGKPVPSPFRAEADARARREHLEWLAAISPEDARRVRGQLREEADPRAQRKQLEWAAQISTECESKLRTLSRAEAEAREGWRRAERFTEMLLEGTWDPSQHPRVPKGQPDGGQWVTTGGSGGANATKPSSFLDAVARRNATIANLTGVVTPGMLRSTRLAAALQSAARLPGEVARAAAAGLLTGVKAVVNGSATAIKSVATLGLDNSQLELIGITKEDRANGYDTAVQISTASGQVLIAVGTGGIASALSKGGSIARTASGSIIAFDAAGNAVGVVQGLYDASQNGVNIANGAQVAGGLLGLGANAKSARDLSRAAATRRLAEVDEFVATLPRTPTPAKSAASQYEIKHAGPYNYTVTGGGAKFDIDGYRGSTILEAKYVGDSKISPYVPGSSCPKAVRDKILKDVRNEFGRARTIIESRSTPFKSIEIVTNSPAAKKFFEGLLKESRVPGNVRLEP